MLWYLLFNIAHARDEIKYDISTPIPSSNAVQFSDIKDYISAIFSFGVYLAFGLALTIIVYGGIRYAASFSNEKDLTNAKDWIWAAIMGLLILVTSTLILNTINPGILSADPFSKIGGASAPSTNNATNNNSDNNNLPLEARCTSNTQCSSGYCDTTAGPTGWCKPGDTTGNKNLPRGSVCTNDVQCSSGFCEALSTGAQKQCVDGQLNLPTGSACYANRQCKSNSCSSSWTGKYCD